MIRLRSTVAALVVAACVLRPVSAQMPPYGGTAEYQADLASRRTRTAAALGAESVLVLWSPPARVYSGDVNYEFRQDTNLLYLTGIAQEETILVLIPGATTLKAALFVRAVDPIRALWYGHVMTPAEVTAASGIPAVFPQHGMEAFDGFMSGLFGGTGYRQSPEQAAAEFRSFFDALKERKAKLWIPENPEGRGGVNLERPEESAHLTWAREMAKRYPGVTPVGAAELLARQRRIKTPYEQRVLTQSVEISAQAHVEGMKATRVGRWEYEVEAVIEEWFHGHGALSPGYPSIVGSGPNATTLHYLDATRQMQNGDLLLVDAAGSFQGLTGDITRTYPVNGRFSPAQRTIYDLVLKAQEAGIAAARPGRRVDDVVAAVREVFAAGLTALGLVRSAAGPEEREAELNVWFPHGPVHGIGMDVHETVLTLDPGVAFVIEPGLYFRSDAFDRLPATMSTRELRTAFEKVRDLGVRIEDSFLMTAAGPVMLSGKAPRAVADIERIVGKGR